MLTAIWHIEYCNQTVSDGVAHSMM